MDPYEYANNLYNQYEQEANDYAQQYGVNLNTSHNGEWDAFRHAYVSGEMTRDYGEAAANFFGELNKIRGDYLHDQPSQERMPQEKLSLSLF